MSRTSKSPKRVLVVAHEIGVKSLGTYSHPFSPRTFTQPQLFACLILKAFFQTDYRGIHGILEDLPDLGAAIGMTKVPHFTTLQKAERRLLNKETTRTLLQETIRAALTREQMKRIVELAAIDGSGFEARHVSHYFVRRRNSKNDDFWEDVTYRRFPKLAVLCDCSTHLILTVDASRGPSPDSIHFNRVLKQAAEVATIQTLLADAGYDSERSHETAHEKYHIHSIIPPRVGRPSSQPPKGKFRRRLAEQFPREIYGQRWQVESVFSMIKRRLGSALRARYYHQQCRELHLRALALNIMILFLFT